MCIRDSLGLHGSGGEHHALLGTGDSESGSNHGIQQCFGEVVANTAYLARRRHVHTQYRVCLVQTGEGELACLHTDTVDVECRLVRLCIGSVQHDTGSSLDEVTLQHLGYEREAARCTEVTLDNLHLVVACQELDIERTGNIEMCIRDRYTCSNASFTDKGTDVLLISCEVRPKWMNSL